MEAFRGHDSPTVRAPDAALGVGCSTGQAQAPPAWAEETRSQANPIRGRDARVHFPFARESQGKVTLKGLPLVRNCLSTAVDDTGCLALQAKLDSSAFETATKH